MSTMDVDAPPSADMPSRGGFLGFVSSIPGILTAVAGLITALTYLYAVHVESRSPEPITEAAQPAPEASVDAGSVVSRADSTLAGDDAMLSDAATVLWTDCGDGYVDSCASLLDLLVDDCYYGDPYSCDALYWVSPVDSDYETYGATCGGRFDSQYGRCSEL
jgi:hypothetical protein